MVSNQPRCYHEWTWVPVVTNYGKDFVKRCVHCGRESAK